MKQMEMKAASVPRIYLKAPSSYVTQGKKIQVSSNLLHVIFQLFFFCTLAILVCKFSFLRIQNNRNYDSCYLCIS